MLKGKTARFFATLCVRSNVAGRQLVLFKTLSTVLKRDKVNQRNDEFVGGRNLVESSSTPAASRRRVSNSNEQYTSRRNNALFLPIEPLCTHALMLFTGWPFKTEEYKRACAHHIAWVAGQQLLFLFSK